MSLRRSRFTFYSHKTWLSANQRVACEQALLFGQAKRASRERASEGPRKGELATIPLKFSFPPRKPRDSAKRENCHRKRAACQVSLDSRGRVELFIYKSLSQQHQGNVFNHWYVFFFTGTSNFNVSSRIRTHYFDSRFVYFWKVVHTAA